MFDRETMRKYAELVVKKGVNIQKNQALMINAPLEGVEFTKLVVEEAYKAGAKDVHINWGDDDLTLWKFQYAPNEVLENVPQWRINMYESFAKDGAALLSIHATDPDLLKDINPEKIAKANKASAKALANFRKYTMNDEIPWSVISIPTAGWAKKVFPDKTEEEAVKSLWEEIIKIVRVDEKDPIAAWDQHNESLRIARERLNEKAYTALRFKTKDTDLEVGLPKNHIWHGGSAVSTEGIIFNPNMPTEEVFCAPHKYKVEGKVTSTKPLNYGGILIDNFTLYFKEGKVVDFSAEKGEEALEHLLDIDEGAKRLGEVALVPHESPVSKSGMIFYNTLFDENASCHLALGKAYPTNIKGGAKMTEEELDKHGINDSLTHVDFMIGTEDLSIDGVLADGTTEPVFRSGTWAFDLK